ncbi:hypothetical protein BDDG_08428 [Blastomyces dermatitidis ATCC 18188]|uniref:Uncharacterized protein n=1 Tax=Ajellomyces dermatitidis (strain ATCC 18188 / CBS 674.68) TaxID=653446 RepID=F2TQH0_AJEDA|nr:hypothetical protein BDDG_08428 [Blastomyces dermatitidis ATCC 18188]
MQQDKRELINALRAHRINTITELRTAERTLMQYALTEVTEPLSQAWIYYVNSNNLLCELRALTKNYPFSSECLDDAKALTVSDPKSARSWNYCWLVLSKMLEQAERQLIPKHARDIAANPVMWGGRAPALTEAEQLSDACTAEWTMVAQQMLRHWERPPIKSDE